MLEVWKKKWRASHDPKGDGRRASIGGPDLTASGLESNEAVLPNGDSSSAGETSSGPSKRHHETSPSDSRKRKKLSSELSGFVESADGHEVLGFALRENTIFTAPNSDAAVGFLAKYILRIWEDRQDTKDIEYPVVVVDAPSDIERTLHTTIPQVDVVTYESVGSNFKQSKRKVVIMNSFSLLGDLTHGSIELKRIGSLDLGDGFRGVVFVHRRIVAYILQELLLMLESELGFLRVCVLVGARSLDTSSYDDVLTHLKDGFYNLLIATKSIEDLDIPKVSVIIQFDLFDSQLSHAHVLSHSGSECHLITMVERGNPVHSAIISHLSNSNTRVRAWMNVLCRTPQSSIAREIPYTNGDPYLSDSEQESEHSFIKDPTTGSRLYPQDAMNAMHILAVDDGKSGDEESLYNPMFDFDIQDDGRFVCRVKAAGQFQDVQQSWSTPSSTKAGARRLASYDACAHLYERGLLDSRVFPKNWTIPPDSDILPAFDPIVVGTRVYEDALIQDRWTQYTRRYDAVKIRLDLNPLSKPRDPELQEYDNLVEFCKAHRRGFEGLKDYTQPLLEVSLFPSFIDRLNPAAAPFTPSTSQHKYLIPELCAKVTIPASTFRTALLLPCIMRRLDDFLLVKELNAGLLSHCVSEGLLHVAISAPSAGIEYDYERLELLGDAFLKLLSSIYIFVMYPEADEASMHNYRQAIIANKSLLRNAVAVGLPAFIQSRPFSFKGWHPPEISSRNTNEDFTNMKANIGSDDDNLSSASEIKSGTGSTAAGREQSPRKTRTRSQPVQRLGDKLKRSWVQHFYLRVEKVFEHVSVEISSSTIKAVEAVIGCRFKRPQFLVQALTHISKTGVHSTTYERLEFIGDAILDFMVVRHVFHRHHKMSPGLLSLLKGAMVSNAALAAVCVTSGLHQHLLFESDKLAHDIREYEYLLRRAQTEEYTSAEREGRPAGQFWHNIESPKVLSDLLESILGALYVSDKYSPVGSDAFFEKVFKPFYDRHITLQTLSHHPTKILFELLQRKGCEKFSLVKESNEYLVLVHDVILASTQDEVGISGAKVASSIGLYALEGDPGFLARTCDCWKKAK
ncbi:Dicer-like protein 1 [Lentinula edodes]|uniref:Dicer-like protein 1 n=1 Tax=Lentinula edodes TaxID=5353 RepID=A0A1Q3EKE9_LENED|nr:Dicer-like protein 1 [Lentinula edodes]